MKILRWALLLVLMLVALAIAVVGLAVATLDPNDYKNEIAAQAEKALGRELRIEGDIAWSLFPWLALNLGKTTLANPPGFGEPVFASFDEVDVQVALLPLLQKKIQASKISLHGASLSLHRKADGSDNWSDLAPERGSAKPPEVAESEAAKQQPASVELDVAGIEIVNASLTLRDEQAGSSLSIAPFNLSTGALTLGAPVAVVANLTLQIDALTLDLKLSGKLTADPQAGRYRMQQLAIKPVLRGAAIPNGEIAVTAALDLEADLNAGTLAISDLVLDALDVSLQGSLQVTDLLSAAAYRGSFSTNSFEPRQLLQQLGVGLPEFADKDALGLASLTFDVSGDQTSARVEKLMARLDDSRLEGSIAVTDFERQSITFDLDLDRLVLDRYLPAKSAPLSEPAVADTVVSSDKIDLPLELLRSLQLDGNLQLGTLDLHHLRFSNVSLGLTAAEGQIRISPLKARAYEGHAEIRALLDVRGKVPLYEATLALKGMRSGDILQALFDDRLVSGVMNLDATLSARGNSLGTLKKSLNGQFQSKFTDGTIKGSKLSAKIIEAQNFLRKFDGRDPLSNEITDDTRFSVMSASGDIKNGVLSNTDLLLIAPALQAKGEGKVDLAEETLDYTVSLGRPPKDETERTFVPLRIRGPFSDLSYKLLLEDVAKQRAKLELEKKQEELKAKAEEEKARLLKKAEEEKAKLKDKVEAEKDKLKDKLDAEKDKLKDEAGAALGDKQEELKNMLEQQLNDKLRELLR